jgi:hypothetical protein
MTPQEQELIKGLFDRLSQNCSPFPFGWSGENLSLVADEEVLCDPSVESCFQVRRTVNRTVTPTRRPNGDLRTREYLTEAEVERLMTAARKNRWGHRDATNDPCGLQTRAPGVRVGRPAVGSGGFWDSGAARPQG